MDTETIEGGPSHKPVAPVLSSFQSPLFDEHKDPQMGGAELFRSFHDRYRFFSVDSIFHGDVSLSCRVGEYPSLGRGIVNLTATGDYHFTCQLRRVRGRTCDPVKTGDISCPDPDGRLWWKHCLPKTSADCLCNRHPGIPELFSLVPVEIGGIVAVVRRSFDDHSSYRE
jgi:hypothetical protein